MSSLRFEVTGARPDRMALAPVLEVGLRISVDPDVAVQSMLLHCQIRVEPQRRAYDDQEQSLLHDVFGAPERWADTLKPFLLTHVTIPVRGFQGSTEITLPVEMSYDLEVTAGKYLRAVRDGEIPLLFLFNGTVFRRGDPSVGSGMQVEPIPWELEARHRLPVQVWDELMELHFPGTGWLLLRQETIDALQAVKSRHALPTWDDAVAHLLHDGGAGR